jgi:hypothetical protein
VHVDLDGARDGAGRRVVEEVRPVPAVPEVVGRVLVGDEDEGDRVVGGEDADGGGGIVFGGVGGEGLEDGFSEWGNMVSAAGRTWVVRCMIKGVERTLGRRLENLEGTIVRLMLSTAVSASFPEMTQNEHT